MYAEERQRLILERVRREGRVDVAALAAEYDVTYETIRRDLTALERHGALRRVHGGAIPVERLGFEPTLTQCDTLMTKEKERIAKATLAELPDEGAVFLDDGSTTGRLAEQIPVDRELTIVTNSAPGLGVPGTGGDLRRRRVPRHERHLRRTLPHHPDPSEARVKRAMIRAARRVVLLADHTKVGDDHFTRFASVEEVDRVITDTGLADGLSRELAAIGPRVTTV